MKSLKNTLIFWCLILELFSVMPQNDTHRGAPTESKKKYAQGIIHLHSQYSHDGGGTIEKIAEAGKKAGIDFIVLTDHDSSRARKEGKEKNYDGVDLFVETEASLPAGHALVFYSHTPLVNKTDAEINKIAWQHYIGESVQADMFLIIAHPSNLKNPWSNIDRNAEGMELLNFDSAWQRQLSEATLGFGLTALLSVFNPHLASLRFTQFHPKDLVVWDNANVLNPAHFGIVAPDTHEKLKIHSQYSMAWPTYEDTFKLANNVVFLPNEIPTEFKERKKVIYDAIRKGRIALHFPQIFPFEGNGWTAQCDSRTYYPGDKFNLSKGCEFKIQTPNKFPFPLYLKLYRQGEMVKQIDNPADSFTLPITQSGMYRIELWAKVTSTFRLLINREVPYLFYNPIFVQ